jgi:DNA-binding winged helix-turn-helix (wHTH) protein
VLVEAEDQVRREEIYERVCGYAMVHGDRSVDVFVRKLRQKLEKASPDCSYIHTHFGIGYRFAAEPVQPTHRRADRGRTRGSDGLHLVAFAGAMSTQTGHYVRRKGEKACNSGTRHYG